MCVCLCARLCVCVCAHECMCVYVPVQALTLAQLQGMKLSELKEACRSASLPVQGTKADLLAALIAYHRLEAPSTAAPAATPTPAATPGRPLRVSVFSAGAVPPPPVPAPQAASPPPSPSPSPSSRSPPTPEGLTLKKLQDMHVLDVRDTHTHTRLS